MTHIHLNRSTILAALLFAISFSGCKSTQQTAKPAKATTAAATAAETTTPLFKGLGDHHRAVTTKSFKAQSYFDQGLIFAFSFNHDEAIRSFTEAARLDPTCVMAWWGVALCNGPHINNAAMDAAHIQAAWGALQKARALRDYAGPIEQMLIDALVQRYRSDPKADRAPLDEAYADAMRAVHKKYPRDTDVATLFAESLMNLRPWDLWSHDGQPRPETPEILATLEGVMLADPKHPGANHLYIHAVEASPNPEKALAAADRLRTLVPAAGHMVHMPAHIDVRVGKWESAAKQNQAAIKADQAYRAISPNQGFYHIYMAHNNQFLSWANMMRGRRAESMTAARAMLAGVPIEFIENMGPQIDGYLVIALDAMMRFGMWEEILKEPAPHKNLPICKAFWHFVRAVALSALDRIPEAEREQIAFRQAVQAIPENAIMAINPAHKVLSIADKMLIGEMAFRRGDLDLAVKELTEAVAIEDDLLYMEPPDWMVPVRHALGAVLMSAGRAPEAESVYRADLKYWPENGWALFGLWKSLDQQHKPEATAVKTRFDKIWAGSDTPLKFSCMCVTKGK